MSYIAVLCLLSFAFCEGYYWREWDGAIPQDAFKAGRDSRGDTYIVQGYVPKTGIYIGQIFSDQQKLFVNTVVYGNKPVIQSDYDLKILCSTGHDLNWMVSNINSTRDILENKIGRVELVKGGVTSEKNTVYIGKKINEHNVFIGSVHGDWRPNKDAEYYLYYSNLVPLSGFSTYYEILTTL